MLQVLRYLLFAHERLPNVNCIPRNLDKTFLFEEENFLSHISDSSYSRCILPFCCHINVNIKMFNELTGSLEKSFCYKKKHPTIYLNKYVFGQDYFFLFSGKGHYHSQLFPSNKFNYKSLGGKTSFWNQIKRPAALRLWPLLSLTNLILIK